MAPNETEKWTEDERTLTPVPKRGEAEEERVAPDINLIRQDSGEAAKRAITEEEFEKTIENGDLQKINEMLMKIESITPGMAQTLAMKYRSPFLNLENLKEISEETIRELIKFGDKGGILSRKKIRGQSIKLDGLEKISVKEAEALTKFKGSTITLNGLTSLDVETARALAKFKGEERNRRRLYLNGIESINVEIAEELAKFQVSELMLGGIKEIGEKEAVALAKFGGEKAKGKMLSLSGLENIGFGAAREIRRFERRGGTLDVSRHIRKIIDQA